MKREILDQLLEARSERRALAVVTELSSGEQRIVQRQDAHNDPVSQALSDAFRFDRSGVHVHDGQEYFVDVHNPSLRMIIVGAVHIAQSLAPVAVATGYQVSVIDPRAAFATAERFADIPVATGWPDEMLPELGLDHRTAVCVLTHDPKIDDPALLIACASEAFYVGALGSRRNHATRLQRLEAAGGKREQLERISGPIGLDIGARGAPEIAISIMAEVTKTLRQGAALS